MHTPVFSSMISGCSLTEGLAYIRKLECNKRSWDRAPTLVDLPSKICKANPVWDEGANSNHRKVSIASGSLQLPGELVELERDITFATREP